MLLIEFQIIVKKFKRYGKTQIMTSWRIHHGGEGEGNSSALPVTFEFLQVVSYNEKNMRVTHLEMC